MGNQTIADRTVFSSGARAFSVQEMLAAAQFRAELAEPWRDFLRVVAAEAKAEENAQEVEDAAIDAAVEQFRYRYDLITAEETERWVEDRGLTLSDFSAYFVRQYWGETANQDAAGAEIDYLDAPDDLRALFTIELILSGALEGLTTRASWRVAARAAAPGEIDAQLLATEEERFRDRHGLSAGNEAKWLGKLGRDPEWLREQLALEASYERDCHALLTREARAREISALRLPLTNFEVETIEFDSLDAAREGFLCVRQDGMTMEEVATEGRYPYRHTEVLLEDVPEDLQQKFLSVTPGEVLDPITHGEGFHLCRIIKKAEPELDDPLVKTRAENRILDRHFDELTAQHVQWPRLPVPVAK